MKKCIVKCPHSDQREETATVFLWSEIMNLLHWKLLMVQQKLLEAMEKEMESLEEKNLVELDGSKWVFKLKVGADDSVECYKARLVALSFTHFQSSSQD